MSVTTGAGSIGSLPTSHTFSNTLLETVLDRLVRPFQKGATGDVRDARTAVEIWWCCNTRTTRLNFASRRKLSA